MFKTNGAPPNHSTAEIEAMLAHTLLQCGPMSFDQFSEWASTQEEESHDTELALLEIIYSQ